MSEDIGADPDNLIIVIQPGSLNLRIGLSTDTQPKIVPHCIARQCKPEAVSHRQQSIPRTTIPSDSVHFKRAVGVAEKALETTPLPSGKLRGLTVSKQLRATNSNVHFETTEVVPPLNWTPMNRSYYIGEEALYMSPDAHYLLNWPYRSSRLNADATLTSNIQDLEDIWTWVMETKLDIPKSSFEQCRCILLVPDVFVRQHVRELVNMLLTRMGLASVIVHQENVCATYAIGLPTACYVDVGDQKVSISCIEDGVSLPESRITLTYGGADVSRVFLALLGRIGFPVNDLNVSDALDCNLLRHVKERHGHLDCEQCGTNSVFIQRKYPQTPISKLQLEVGDESILAPMAFFFPEMFCLDAEREPLVYQMPTGLESEPDDPFDDLYIVLTSRDRKKRDDGDNEGDEDDDETDVRPQQRLSQRQKSLGQGTDSLSSVPSLDEAIWASIQRCEQENQEKMLSCVIVVGDGFRFEGAQDWLQQRLWARIPREYRVPLDSIDVITSFKDLTPGEAAWKGATMITCADSVGDLWISRQDWVKYGCRVIREKAPFMW